MWPISGLGGVFHAHFWPRVKYALRSIQNYASLRLVEIVRDCRSRYFLVLSGLPILHQGRPYGLDWRIHDYCRRTRLYWTLFGRNYPFFKGQELKRLQAPQFAIEFDQDDHDQYTPQLTVTDGTDGRPRIERKFLKVAVCNVGLGVARRCKATIQVLTKDDRMIIPSREPKEICWENGGTRQDIGAVNGRERLILVASDSRIGALTENRFAYVCTPNWMNPSLFELFRKQDGIGLGDFEFQLLVTESRTGHQYYSAFRVHVTENWRELSMTRIR